MEIYNEIVNDLLTPGNTNLKIHEDPVKGVYVGNLKEVQRERREERGEGRWDWGEEGGVMSAR